MSEDAGGVGMGQADFNMYMRQVDRIVDELAGLSIYDLADYTFRDAYNTDKANREWNPRATALAALRADGWEG